MYNLPQRDRFLMSAPLLFDKEKREYRLTFLFPRLIGRAYKVAEAMDQGFEMIERNVSGMIPIEQFKPSNGVFHAEYHLGRWALRKADAISLDGKFIFNEECQPTHFSFKGLLFVKDPRAGLIVPSTTEALDAVSM